LRCDRPVVLDGRVRKCGSNWPVSDCSLDLTLNVMSVTVLIAQSASIGDSSTTGETNTLVACSVIRKEPYSPHEIFDT